MFKYILTGIIFLGLVLSIAQSKVNAHETKTVVNSSTNSPVKEFSLESVPPDSLFTLHSIIGMEATTEECQKAFWLALQLFPELKNIKFEILQKPLSTTMQARPNVNSFFGKKRSYTVFINNDPNFEGIQFKDIPFNAKIGIICHELCHLLDYEQKSKGQIIQTGIRFLSTQGRASYEKSIDYAVIEKGAGWQLYDWAYYAINQSKASPEYKEFKKQNYLQPSEINEIIESLTIYQLNQD